MSFQCSDDRQGSIISAFAGCTTYKTVGHGALDELAIGSSGDLAGAEDEAVRDDGGG